MACSCHRWAAEVVGAVGMKCTEGSTRLRYSALVFPALVASFYLLSAAVGVLPIGTAYAIWTGIGTIGTALFGIILFAVEAAVDKILDAVAQRVE